MADPVNELPLVDPRNGNINVHGRQGFTIDVAMKNPDGSMRNISATPLFFEIGGVKRVALTAGTDNFHRKIVVGNSVLQGLALRQAYAFALRDETVSDGAADVPWSGLLTVYGFDARPPT